MRFALLALVLAACGDDSSTHTDAPPMVDAKVIDAAVDASPDATPMNIVDACKHVCDALAVCGMDTPDPQCYSGCQADLLDCTMEQVQTLDACSTQACGDQTNSPIIDCISMVACVMG